MTQLRVGAYVIIIIYNYSLILLEVKRHKNEKKFHGVQCPLGLIILIHWKNNN